MEFVLDTPIVREFVAQLEEPPSDVRHALTGLREAGCS
jgi:hypothetical protein